MSTQNLTKIKSYLGFAAKSGKIIYGTDNIVKKKCVPLILICDTASINTVKQIKNFSDKTSSPLIILEGDAIDEILKKHNCKIVAITDINLAKAIIDNA